MVAVDPRAAVTRPCAGCALPWNASFMTIPSNGDYRGSTLRFELQLEPATLGLRAGGFAVEGAVAGVVCSWGGEDFGQAGTWAAGCGPFTRAATYHRRISAGYFPGGYPPVDRMPYGGLNARVTRRNTRHNRHSRLASARGARSGRLLRVRPPGEPRMRVGGARPCLIVGEGLSRCAPAGSPRVVDRSPA